MYCLSWVPHLVRKGQCCIVCPGSWVPRLVRTGKCLYYSTDISKLARLKFERMSSLRCPGPVVHSEEPSKIIPDALFECGIHFSRFDVSTPMETTNLKSTHAQPEMHTRTQNQPVKHMFHPRNCLHDSAPARPQRERQTPTRSHTRGGDLGCFNLASWLPQQTMSVLLRHLQKARKGTMSCQHDTARHVNRSSCTCRRSRII